MIFQKSQPSYKYSKGVCTMKTDGAKKSAKPPALRSLLPPGKVLEINIKLSHCCILVGKLCNR